MFTQSKLLVGVIGAVFMAAYTFGVYQGGYQKGLAESEITIANYEKEILKLEAEKKKAQEKTSIKIETKYIETVKTVKEKEKVYVDRATNDVVSTGELSAGWVYVHDAAARGVHAEAAPASDGTPSSIEDNQALAIITENYSICRTDQERLRSLQEWISKSNEEINSE